jgi:hypothetical protein
MFDIGKNSYKSDLKLGERYRDKTTGVEGHLEACYVCGRLRLPPFRRGLRPVSAHICPPGHVCRLADTAQTLQCERHPAAPFIWLADDRSRMCSECYAELRP